MFKCIFEMENTFNKVEQYFVCFCGITFVRKYKYKQASHSHSMAFSILRFVMTLLNESVGSP